MDQNNTEKINESLQPQIIQSTEVVENLQPKPVKSNSSILKISLVIIVVILASGAGYFTYNFFKSNTKEDNKTTNNAVVEEKATINPAVEAINDLLTGGSISESGITNTDDSLVLDESINATENLGDSIDENSF